MFFEMLRQWQHPHDSISREESGRRGGGRSLLRGRRRRGQDTFLFENVYNFTLCRESLSFQFRPNECPFGICDLKCSFAWSRGIWNSEIVAEEEEEEEKDEWMSCNLNTSPSSLPSPFLLSFFLPSPFSSFFDNNLHSHTRELAIYFELNLSKSVSVPSGGTGGREYV
jgi:hypothetical protein